MAKTWKCFLVPSPSHKHNPHPDNCGPPNATIWEEFIVYFFNWSYSPVKSLSRVWLFATPWIVHQPPGSSVPGIFQARILEWVAISFSRKSSRPKDRTHVSCISRWILYCWATTEALWQILPIKKSKPMTRNPDRASESPSKLGETHTAESPPLSLWFSKSPAG